MRGAICVYAGCAFAVCLIGISGNTARAQQSVPGVIVEHKGTIVERPASPPAASTSAAAGPVRTAVAASPASASLDIVGIEPGMTVRDAMLALKADNPRLNLAPTTLQLEGFSDQLMPAVTGTESITTGPTGIVRPGERVTLAFTLPPSQEVLWAVQRSYDFATAERPGLQVTLDALRKKYGLETDLVNPGPNTNFLTWIFDSMARPVGARGAQLHKACTLQVESAITGNPANDIQGGPHWPQECSSVIIARASVAATQDQASSQFVVTNLTVALADAARYRASIDATRSVVANAAKTREKTQTEQVNRRAPPKL